MIPEFDPWTNNVESILERDNALYLTGSTSLMDAYNVMRRHRFELKNKCIDIIAGLDYAVLLCLIRMENLMVLFILQMSMSDC